MGRNKPIIFEDLDFKPHKFSVFFSGHSTIFLEGVGRVSIVGPYNNVYGLPSDDSVGTYEIWAMDLWDDPIPYLSVEELSEILFDLQKSPLDFRKRLDKFKFTK